MDLESYDYTYDVRDNETYNLTNLYYGDEVKSKYFFNPSITFLFLFLKMQLYFEN